MSASRTVLAIYGIALAAGGFTHPFLGAIGHTVQGLGLLVAAAGFAGASTVLGRMPNDALPPLSESWVSTFPATRDTLPLGRDARGEHTRTDTNQDQDGPQGGTR